ncbi:hypothetical protein ACFL5O_06510 [Myxococcota bacterium]
MPNDRGDFYRFLTSRLLVLGVYVQGDDSHSRWPIQVTSRAH